MTDASEDMGVAIGAYEDGRTGQPAFGADHVEVIRLVLEHPPRTRPMDEFPVEVGGLVFCCHDEMSTGRRHDSARGRQRLDEIATMTHLDTLTQLAHYRPLGLSRSPVDRRGGIVV